MNRADELTLVALDRALTPVEEEELNAIFQQDPRALRSHLLLLRLECCLVAENPGPGCARTTERVMSTIRQNSEERVLERVLATLHQRVKPAPVEAVATRVRRRIVQTAGEIVTFGRSLLQGWTLTGMAACLAILAAYFSFQGSEEIATLTSNRPGVAVERSRRVIAVKGELRLRFGDIIRVNKGSEAAVRYADGTSLILGERTTVMLPAQIRGEKEGKLVEMRMGALQAQVAKQPPAQPMMLMTPTATATVVGTELQPYVNGDSTRLNVRDGVVLFHRLADSTEVRVSKGEQAMADHRGLRPLAVTSTDAGRFEEKFEDAHFDSRGWYDEIQLLLSEKEHIPGSKSSAEFRFLQDGVAPASGNARRRRFSKANGVQADYWIKHSPNWSNEEPVGHVILMTNKNEDWEGTDYTHLTVIIGTLGEYPAIFVQDGQNIDETRLGQDLTEVTERRAVAGGNGDSDGYGEGILTPTGYPSGAHANKKTWVAKKARFGNDPSKSYKGDWRHVQVSVRLNSISNGRAVPDGQLRYWVDGELVMNYDDVVLRTAVNGDMQFDQFLIAPYVTGGSPEEQTLWLDDLSVTPDRAP